MHYVLLISRIRFEISFAVHGKKIYRRIDSAFLIVLYPSTKTYLWHTLTFFIVFGDSQ